jgi:hypothetical protein
MNSCLSAAPLARQTARWQDQRGERFTPADSIAAVKADFVAVAASYGDRKGIIYTAWRELGAPAAALTQGNHSTAPCDPPARSTIRTTKGHRLQESPP